MTAFSTLATATPATSVGGGAGLGQGLSMYSGFKTNVTMEVPIDPPNNQDRSLHGIDAQTGFNWDTAQFNGKFWTVAEYVGTPPGNMTDYVYGEIETVAGPAGVSTKALKIGLKATTPSVATPQVMLQAKNLAQPITDIYTRYWTRLDPSLQAQANSAQPAPDWYWRMFWEYKTWTDFRMKVEIQNHHAPGPHWVITADETGWNDQVVGAQLWTIDSPIKVPLDQWFYVEIYNHRATDASGRFFFAVNGQVVCDRMGANYGADYPSANSEVAIFTPSICYSHIPNNAYQWITNLEVGTLPPNPAVLPSGPPPPL